MAKRISNLNKEKIGKLFPIELTTYNPSWKEIYELECELIASTIGEFALRIEHIGSTAIPGLMAKDSIDILVEILDEPDIHNSIVKSMQGIGYDFMWQKDGDPPYRVFFKGYDVNGKRSQTYHIHMGPSSHSIWDRIYFRDYLIEKPELARQYSLLKTRLAKIYRNDRLAYRQGKTEFVKLITEQAKRHYLLKDY